MGGGGAGGAGGAGGRLDAAAPPDLARDLAPDLARDLAPDLARDLAPDLASNDPDVPPPATNPSDWTQHAHDAQRTSYTEQVVAPPWRFKWAWNGPNAQGGIANGKTTLPRNVQPVTGAGRVYVARGAAGVTAINNTNGAEAWTVDPGGSVDATVAYDPDTAALFVPSTDGRLYKLNPSSGATLGMYNAGAPIVTPPAVLADRVIVSAGGNVIAIGKQNLNLLWSYAAGSTVETPPAYSPSRNRVLAVSADLYVHAIDNADGQRAWRVKPTPRAGGNPGDNQTGLAESRWGWPVVAEVHGYVLIKYRLDWQTLWTWNPWPTSNTTIRTNLTNNPGQQALYVMDLDDGSVPFIANVGHGGYGDGGYMPMGPQPAVKRLSSGGEVVWTVIRGDSQNDGRWDSHLGEMVLDDSTVSGLSAGYVRWMQNPHGQYLEPTDEQPNPSVMGDYLFTGHWENGSSVRIVDRGATRGSYANPITVAIGPAIATSQDNTGQCAFNATTHYCANGLYNTRPYPAGFYIYYNQGAVYDAPYWSEYAVWVVSGSTVYFRSCDGAVVALEAGSPTSVVTTGESAAARRDRATGGGAAGGAAMAVDTRGAPAFAPGDPSRLRAAPAKPATGPAILAWRDAAAHAGEVKTVELTLASVFNNRAAVYLGATAPHNGAFKIRIMRDAWGAFGAPPETIYRPGQRVRVTGRIVWYQGDPTIYATSPDQLRVAR